MAPYCFNNKIPTTSQVCTDLKCFKTQSCCTSLASSLATLSYSGHISTFADPSTYGSSLLQWPLLHWYTLSALPEMTVPLACSFLWWTHSSNFSWEHTSSRHLILLQACNPVHIRCLADDTVPLSPHYAMSSLRRDTVSHDKVPATGPNILHIEHIYGKGQRWKAYLDLSWFIM